MTGNRRDRFSAFGFFVVAPHLYHREGSPEVPYDDVDEAKVLMSHMSADGIQNDLDATTDFLKQNGDPYTRIARDEPGTVAINFGLYGVPETYLVDKSGIVRWRWAGGMSEDVVQQYLAPLLKSLA